MSNVKGGKSTTMSYGNTESGSVNEEEKKKRVNPFEGQKIMVNGKLVDRTPANSPGGP